MVNIWASIVHLSDEYFSSASDAGMPDLDFLICEGLRNATLNRQTWMINPMWKNPGTTAALLRESYNQMKNTIESYLVLVTPGFADAQNKVPARLFESQLNEIIMRARVFNKRAITVLLGIPPNCPKEIADTIKKYSEVTKSITQKYNGVLIDLSGMKYEAWSPKGSRPVDLSEISLRIVEGIMECHSGSSKWKALRNVK